MTTLTFVHLLSVLGRRVRAAGWGALIGVVLAAAGLLAAPTAQAARIKEVASVQGVRPNQLVGYGLVVGLMAPATRPRRRRSRRRA